MDKDRFIRGALLASAVLNLGAALVFAFPDSLGQFGGMPIPVPHIYTSLLAVFVILFGGAYAWLARQPIIDRPLVGLSAIGKAGVFTIILAFWILGDLPIRGLLAAGPDLVFAGIFARWLAASKPVAKASAAGGRGQT